MFCLSLILLFLNLALFYWLAVWCMYIVLSVIIFQKIRNHFLRNPDKVRGRVFEMFFFLSLFMASYSVTLITADWFRELMMIAFIFSAVGGAYCGYMHYIDGLFTQNYTIVKKRKNIKKKNEK